MKNAAKSYRLFFALWPTDKVRQLILDRYSLVSSQVSGVVMRPDNLHVTLHFIGRVIEHEKACLHKAAQSVRANSFCFDLSCFDSFQKAKIFWMGPQTIPTELSELQRRLGIALATCGYESDNRPYKPHVTLLKNFKGGNIACDKNPQIILPAPSDDVTWEVTEFVLVESVSSSRGINYQVIEKYPLSCDKP